MFPVAAMVTGQGENMQKTFFDFACDLPPTSIP